VIREDGGGCCCDSDLPGARVRPLIGDDVTWTCELRTISGALDCILTV